MRTFCQNWQRYKNPMFGGYLVRQWSKNIRSAKQSERDRALRRVVYCSFSFNTPSGASLTSHCLFQTPGACPQRPSSEEGRLDLVTLHLWFLHRFHSPAKAPAVLCSRVSPPFPPRHRWERNTNACTPWSPAPPPLFLLLLLPLPLPHLHHPLPASLHPWLLSSKDSQRHSPERDESDFSRHNMVALDRRCQSKPRWDRAFECIMFDLRWCVALESHPYLSFFISDREGEAAMSTEHSDSKPEELVLWQIWYIWPRLRGQSPAAWMMNEWDLISIVCKDAVWCFPHVQKT